MNRKYEYATDKIYNLIGNEGTDGVHHHVRTFHYDPVSTPHIHQ